MYFYECLMCCIHTHINLECVHHFHNSPLSPLTFFTRFHPVLTFTMLQADSIPSGAGTKHTSCSRRSQVCARGGSVPNTGDSHGFIFAWHSEQRRALQLSSSDLRNTSCGAAALSVCDVMREGDNLAFVLYTLHLPLWWHCCVAHMSSHSILYSV